MVEPALEMCSVAEHHGAKLTFFVDVCMLWAFQEAKTQGILEESYEPGAELEDHLLELVKRGHDIQLHLHPQWLRWRYYGAGKWELDLDLWRLPQAISSGVVKDAEELFSRGKQTLEKLIRPLRPDYACVAFRAGAWSIQPEAEILRAMAGAGLKIDSTVAHGMRRSDALTSYDFTHCPDNRVYPIKDSLEKVDPTGSLQEWPITTVPVRLMEKTGDKWRKSRNGIRGSAPSCHGSAHGGSSLDKWRRLLEQKWQMLSLDGTDATEMIRITKRALSRSDQETIRLVMIGHSKNFANPKELDKYLSWCVSQNISLYSRFDI